MKKWLKQFGTEDWIIVFAAFIILGLAILFPAYVPKMPQTLNTTQDWLGAGYMFLFILAITIGCQVLLKRKVGTLPVALLTIFGIALVSQLITQIPAVMNLKLEVVLFSVAIGLFISNVFRVPEWLKPAIQSEFYIKIGIVCLGSTILFGEVMKSGMYGLGQAVIVVFIVWYFAYWLARKMKIDEELGVMMASALSICGVSAAIATCGAIKGNNKKLSYVVSVVLIIAIPMMYLMPWLARQMGLSDEVAGAWIGGTIDTTGAVAASATMLGETAAQTAIIVKSSQNVLLGVAAFVISLFWSFKSQKLEEKPTLRVIWDRFPKFVVGFIIASVVFSFCFDTETAKSVGKITKGFTNTLFSLAFVCIGLETRFKDIFSKENRKPFIVFVTAQSFNIVVTLIVVYLMFGVLKPYVADF